MGDRTWLSFIVHPDDLENPAWKQWIEDMGETQGWQYPTEDWPGGWDCEEINYAGYSDLETLAAAGVRFIGEHGAGHEYSASIFFADGKDGTVEYSPVDTWETYRLVIRLENDECLAFDQDEVDRQFDLIRRFHALDKEVRRDRT